MIFQCFFLMCVNCKKMRTFALNLCVLLLFLLVKRSAETEEKYFETFYENPFDPFERNAVKMESYKWPHGKILYRFNEKYSKFKFSQLSYHSYFIL